MVLNMFVTVIPFFFSFAVDKYRLVIEIHAWSHSFTAQRTYRLAYETCFVPYFAFQFHLFGWVCVCVSFFLLLAAVAML